MATYNSSTYQYTHEGATSIVGLPFVIATDAKRPAISKRVFATYNDANEYIGNSGDTACAGLLLTVTGDTDTNLNGLYTVMTGGTASTGLQLQRASGALTISATTSSEAGILKTYHFITNGEQVGTVDIPKDFLVKSATSYVVSGTSESAYVDGGIPVGHTCLDLVINAKDGDDTETDQHTYVDLTEALGQHHHASAITATEISATDETVAITGNTVAQQLQSIGIQIKNHRGRVSSSGQTEQILTLYDDGIGIVSGATWDCGEWQ